MLVVFSGAGLFVFRPDDENRALCHGRRARPQRGRAGLRRVWRAHLREGSAPAVAGSSSTGARVLRFAHRFTGGDEVGLQALVSALGNAGRTLLVPTKPVLSRRELVVSGLVAGLSMLLLDGCDRPEPTRPADASVTTAEGRRR